MEGGNTAYFVSIQGVFRTSHVAPVVKNPPANAGEA